jgi:hypothetical protein
MDAREIKRDVFDVSRRVLRDMFAEVEVGQGEKDVAI